MLQRPLSEAAGIPRAGALAPRPSPAHFQRRDVRSPRSARTVRLAGKCRWDWDCPGSDPAVGAVVVTAERPRQTIPTRPIPPTATDHPDRMAALLLLAGGQLSGTPAELPDRPARRAACASPELAGSYRIKGSESVPGSPGGRCREKDRVTSGA